MVKDMTETEIRWLTYVSNGLMGFTEHSIKVFVESRANYVLKNLGLKSVYDESGNNPLNKLIQRNLKGGDIESRSNFFETNSTEYSKAMVKVDY